MTFVAEFRNMHILVQEKELVSDADHRNFPSGKAVRDSSQNLVKIHHNVCTTILDTISDQ